MGFEYTPKPDVSPEQVYADVYQARQVAQGKQKIDLSASPLEKAVTESTQQANEAHAKQLAEQAASPYALRGWRYAPGSRFNPSKDELVNPR